MKPVLTYYVGLGSNLGDKEKNLRTTVQKMEKRIGKVLSLSAFYATDPWGFASGNPFLNAACCLSAPLQPRQVLSATQAIERDLGRLHKSQDGIYRDRLIDIDLLLCFHPDGTPLLLSETDLQLPHPLMHRRAFVMRPLAEIAPQVVHPLLGKTLEELAGSEFPE